LIQYGARELIDGRSKKATFPRVFLLYQQKTVADDLCITFYQKERVRKRVKGTRVK
jgi:hypothetical protein